MQDLSTMISVLLVIDFFLLGGVFIMYSRYSLQERLRLKQQANQSSALEQKIYQAQVLKEISERIGYSLDTNKIIEIITSSLSGFLKYDFLAYIVLKRGEVESFKGVVENRISHGFIEQVKEKMLESASVMLDTPVDLKNADESLMGNVLDDTNPVMLGSYFNLPLIISGNLVGLITLASEKTGLYHDAQVAMLYGITNQAGYAVTKQQAVLDSEKDKLVSIINSMTDGVIMVNKSYQVTVSNPAMNDILHISSGRSISMYDVVDALAGKLDLRTKIEQAVSQHEPIVLAEVFIKEKAFELVITPVKTHEGEDLGAAVVFRDITSEKSLEKLRQEFTAMMVHELRAPLTAVRWSSETLTKELAEHTENEISVSVMKGLKSINIAAANMLDLVNDLLDIAKIEAGKFDLNQQKYDLVAAINQQLEIFRRLAESKHLQLNFTGPKSLDLRFDRVRILQVFSNLLSNAIKYTDAGQIDIYVSEDRKAGRVVIAIKDTGLGISREDLAQLFSKFKQLQTSGNTRKGTGLGLVVSKGIVEAHGGNIWAESAGENLGSTFYFSLPL